MGPADAGGSAAARAGALAEVTALARRHGLTLEEIAAALGGAPTAPGPASHGAARQGRTVLVRVLGFLGGTFVFAGIGVFIAMQWGSMNAPARIVVTLGSGIAAFALALFAARDVRFEKAFTPLLLIAGALEPTGMLVAFDELGAGGDWRLAGLVTAATMALQFGGTFGTVRRSSAMFLALVFGTLFWWTALDLLGVDGTVVALVLGASMLLAAVGVSRTPHHAITPVWYLAGGGALLGGLFDLVGRTPFELLFLAAAVGMVYMSVALHSRMLLFVATAAILAYTGWFTGRHFADSVGWPIALIIFGIMMIGLSALAFRIDRDYVRAGAIP